MTAVCSCKDLEELVLKSDRIEPSILIKRGGVVFSVGTKEGAGDKGSVLPAT